MGRSHEGGCDECSVSRWRTIRLRRGFSVCVRDGTHELNASALAATQPGNDNVAALRAEVERLKAMAPDQSHVMADVGYHYANLWFAARAGNWPLAEFYVSETKSHLRWAVRIIPVRKDAAGHDVDLRSILDPNETSSLKDVQDAVTATD